MFSNDYLNSIITRGIQPYLQDTDWDSICRLVMKLHGRIITSYSDLKQIRRYESLVRVYLGGVEPSFYIEDMFGRSYDNVGVFIRENSLSAGSEWIYDYIARFMLGIKASYSGKFEGEIMQAACILACNRLVHYGSGIFVVDDSEKMKDFETACRLHDRKLLSGFIGDWVADETEFYNKEFV